MGKIVNILSRIFIQFLKNTPELQKKKKDICQCLKQDTKDKNQSILLTTFFPFKLYRKSLLQINKTFFFIITSCISFLMKYL